MTQEIITNRAIVFGAFSPDSPTLAESLDEWDENATSAHNFIERRLPQFYRKGNDLGKFTPIVYVVYSKEGMFKKFSSHREYNQEVTTDKIILDDYHPLQKWIKEFQEAIRSKGGIAAAQIEMEKSSALNLLEIRNTGSELFRRAHRLYKSRDMKAFMEARNKLLNFFSDPVCRYGALVGAIIHHTSEIFPIITPGGQPFMEIIELPLLPPIITDYQNQFNEPSSDADGTQVPALVDLSVRAYPELVSTLSRSLTRVEAARDPQNPGKQIEALKHARETIGANALDEAGKEFLLFCLADHKLLSRVSELNAILLNPQEYLQETTLDINEWSEKIRKLLLLELRVVGGLISNVEGLKCLVSAFPEGCEVPRLLLPNCSLSELYQETRKQKFKSLLSSLNGADSGYDNNINIAVIPSVASGAQNTGSGEDMWFGDAPLASVIDALGDETRFSDFVDFLQFVNQQNLNITTFFSLTDNVSADRLVSKYFDGESGEGFYSFAKKIQNQVSQKEALKYAALCLPDKLIFNECQVKLTDEGGELPIPALTVKAAFLVAAIVMRNDSLDALQKLLPNQSSRLKDQPGIAVGPGNKWQGSWLKTKLPHLFEHKGVASDMNIDSDILARADKQGCYCILQHQKGQNVSLRTLNTLFQSDSDNKVYYPVNAVRGLAYVKTLVNTGTATPSELLKKWQKEEGMDIINTLKPDGIKYDMDNISKAQLSSETITIA